MHNCLPTADQCPSSPRAAGCQPSANSPWFSSAKCQKVWDIPLVSWEAVALAVSPP